MLKDHTSYANMDRYQSLLFFLKVDTVRKPSKEESSSWVGEVDCPDWNPG